MSKKHKNVYRVKQLLILIYIVTGCLSIPAFPSLVGVPIGITSSA